MISNNSEDDIQIHQLLYGYSDGHCLLSGSLKPSGQPERTLLALSDLSHQGCVTDEQSYITGYPLSEMGSYVLSRTWLATEMPRPGSVWTHTLIIDYADLASLNPFSLLKLFKRPHTVDDGCSYCNPLILRNDVSLDQLSEHQLITPMYHLLNGLYTEPNQQIYAQNIDQSVVERLCLSLWFQQWPRLRRNFRFCTCSSSDRSRGSERFDIQFYPQDRTFNISKNGKGNWIDILKPFSGSQEDWLNTAVEDIFQESKKSDLRSFLWRYGAESNEGRRIFRPLVQLWEEFENKTHPNLHSVLAIIKDINPPVRSLSLRVIDEILISYQSENILTPLAIDFLIDNLSLIEGKANKNHISLIASALWQSSPKLIWDFFYSKSEICQSIAIAAIITLQPPEIIKGAAGDVDLFCKILKIHPGLAYSPLIWGINDSISQRSAEVLCEIDKLDNTILKEMFKSNRDEIPQIAVHFFKYEAVNEAIKQYESGNNESQIISKKWLLEAIKFPNLLLNSVSQGVIKSLETLCFISTLVDFRSYPVSKSGDEWVDALNSVEGNQDKCDISFYYFILGRALSGVSPEPLPLIHFSLATVHRDLVRSYRESNRWLRLKEVLPNVPTHTKWDRAYRLRWGIVKFFYSQDLSPQRFFSIFNERKDFKKMVDEASLLSEGRCYLKKVNSWVNDHGGNDVYPWNEIVEDALSPPSKIFGLWDFYSKKD